MNPMNNDKMPPPAAAGAPMPPQAAPPTGAPAPGGAGGDDVRGAQRVSNTEFNQQMQNILLSRIEEEGSRNPNFGQAIASGVSREAAVELALILPELIPIMRMAGLLEGEGGAGPIGQPRPPMGGAPGGGMPPMGQGAAPQTPAGGGYDDEEEDEPRPGVSRGLVG